MTKNKCNKCNNETKNEICESCQMALEDKFKAQDIKASGNRKPKILFYDIETTPIKAWIWRVGEQVIRHHQLDDTYNSTGIICIGYKWNDNKPARVVQWDYNKQNTEKVIEEFDKIANKADIVIGKNSDRFDVKHINTQRMIAGLPGLPNWLNNTEDLESQFRRNFWFPSYSLDYLSKALLKNKGKDRMEFDDWINIVEKRSRESYRKMIKYCKKDVDDTKKLWDFALAHMKPKFNMATFKQELCCKICGSRSIRKNGTRPSGKTMYQTFFCNSHGGYAGRAPINLKNGTFGKIG